MSVTQTLRAVEILRSLGVTVTFEPGWEVRGNGQSSAYQGGIIHHTGGAYNNTCPWILIGGRSDLAGPLCNFAGLANGVIHVVAAHPANHAGASGGPSTGPFPRTSLFNRLVMGLEICYPGAQPMTNEQYRSAKAFAKTMQVMYGDIERARAHRETSIEGKWDPGYAPGKTIDMAALRAEAANQEEDEVSAEQVWGYEIGNPGEEDPAFMWLQQTKYAAKTTEAKVDALAGVVAGIAQSVAELAKKVGPGTGGNYPGDDHVKSVAVDAVREEMND